MLRERPKLFVVSASMLRNTGGGRDAFAAWTLDSAPKFVREKLARAEADAGKGAIETSDPLCFDAAVCIPLS